MSHIFISHVEEDADIALEIALGLEEEGYKTWSYEIDSIPGPSYLLQTGQAIEQSEAIVLVISPHALGSHQVTREVIRSYEHDKRFIPVLRDITHTEFQNRQPEWREAIGSATSIYLPQEGVAGIIDRIINGLKALGIQPMAQPDATRIERIRKELDRLQSRVMPERGRKYQAEVGIEAALPGEPAVAVKRAALRKPIKVKVSNWWWALPVLMGFIGGIISWTSNKDANRRKATNMLVFGILFTAIWLVPLFVFYIPMDSTPPAAANAIKIGVIGPMSYIQGEQHWYGAQMAAEEINAAGGIMLGGESYQIKLVQAESNEIVSPTDAVLAMEKLITVDKVDFVVGGFISESVIAMQETAMENEMIFLGCGASDNLLCENVATDYETYKYWFRVIPVNGNYLAQISFMLAGMVAQDIRALGVTPKVAILAENNVWADPLVAYAEATFPGMGMQFVGTWRPSQMDTDVTAVLTAIEDEGANMIYTVVSGPLGVAYTTQWGEKEIPAASVGINVEAQKGDFLTVTGGYGAYETTLNTYGRVEITDETIDFFDTFVERFGEIPIYTAGTYEALYILKAAIESADTLDADAVVTALEATDLIGPAGRLVFMGKDTATPHDITWGTGYVTGLGVQWQDGVLECVWPVEVAPPAGIGITYEGTVDYILPPWVVEALTE